MKILFCGDIVGSSGRKVVIDNIAKLREVLKLDCVIVNAENSAHGFGITPKIYNKLISSGVDIITLGNHAFDQPVINNYLEEKNNIIRPINYKNKVAGKGYCIKIIKDIKILVINLMGLLFMGDKYTNPFTCIHNFLQSKALKKYADIIIIDFHAETTSEKNAMGLMLDGKVSAVLGTHTHIPTLDARILPNGTGYQTDVGMCGDYMSVIGMNFNSSIIKLAPELFTDNERLKNRISPSKNAGTLSASFLEINDNTGLVEKITPIILGPTLKNTI